MQHLRSQSRKKSIHPDNEGKDLDTPNINYDRDPILQSVRLWNGSSNKIQYIGRITYLMITGMWFSSSLLSSFNASDRNKEMTRDVLEALYDRMLTQWATISIVSSLLLSFVYGVFMSDIYTNQSRDIEFSGLEASVTIAIIEFVSMCSLVTSLISAVVLSMALMTLPKHFSFVFLKEFIYIITFPEFCMLSGLYLFAASTFLAGITLYGYSFSLACWPVLLVTALVLLGLWLGVVLVLDREKGLWESARYTS